MKDTEQVVFNRTGHHLAAPSCSMNPPPGRRRPHGLQMDDSAEYVGTEGRGTPVWVQRELVWGRCRVRQQWGNTELEYTERVGWEKGKEKRDENTSGGREGEKEHSWKLCVLSFKMHTWVQYMDVLGDGGAHRIVCESRNSASLSGGVAVAQGSIKMSGERESLTSLGSPISCTGTQAARQTPTNTLLSLPQCPSSHPCLLL